MNLSNFAHAGIALSFQIVAGLIVWVLGAGPFAASVMGGLFAVGFYFGREVAQAEHKAGGSPWYVGFKVTDWTTDAKLDLLCPLIVCCVVTLGAYLLT